MGINLGDSSVNFTPNSEVSNWQFLGVSESGLVKCVCASATLRIFKSL